MNRMRKHEHAAGRGNDIRDIILGGQDGLVNVLGIVLAVALATSDPRVVIIAGLAAAFAESISMGAVAYTSVKAAKQYYLGEVEREKREMREMPDEERREVRQIYYQKGFRGTLLNRIVMHITSRKKLWLNTMMQEELRLFPEEYGRPGRSAATVFIAALIGSFIPLLPFVALPVAAAVYASVIVSLLALFIAGVVKAHVTIGSKLRSGAELAAIGAIAAAIGFAIGMALGAI